MWFNYGFQQRESKRGWRGEWDQFLTALQTNKEALQSWAGASAFLAKLDIQSSFSSIKEKVGYADGQRMVLGCLEQDIGLFLRGALFWGVQGRLNHCGWFA